MRATLTETGHLGRPQFPIRYYFGNFEPWYSRVSSRDRKLESFRALVGLRRVGRRDPDDLDLAVARVRLEDELGPTVSRRLAAELLGVSHTGLRRWINRGDVPVIYVESGRVEVPVAALLDLYEAVDAERSAGRSHVLEPSMLTARKYADRLPAGLLSDVESNGDGHRQAQLRGLAYHRALATRLTARMVSDARQVLSGWELEGRIDPVYANLWRELLSGPVAEVRRLLGADTEQMADLRQNSPFAGMLTERERRAVLAGAGRDRP